MKTLEDMEAIGNRELNTENAIRQMTMALEYQPCDDIDDAAEAMWTNMALEYLVKELKRHREAVEHYRIGYRKISDGILAMLQDRPTMSAVEAGRFIEEALKKGEAILAGEKIPTEAKKT